MPGKGKLKILALHTETGSRFYRINPQLRWMKSKGHDVQLVRHDVEQLEQLIEWCDVVILQMVFSRDLVDQIKAAGKKVIFECDDLIHRTHELHYSYKETDTIVKRLKMLYKIWSVFHRCDGVIVSSPELKKVYGWMNRHTFVFPNYMQLEHWLKDNPRNTSKRVRILWAGSTSHTGDLYWFKPIMQAILAKYPEVQFIYIGHGGVPTDDLYAKFIYGDDIFEGLPQDRRESLLPAPANVYPYMLATLMADIAVAPLEKNYFNKFKTQCKYLEYAINGIPGVYAKWFYTDVKDYGIPKVFGKALEPGEYENTYEPWETGILADSPQEWIDAISLLVEDATLRRQIGERARKEVIEKYNFTDHAARWQGFVERIGYVAHNS